MVNGVKAIGVANGTPFQMPVLKFSDKELVSGLKRNILEALDHVGAEVESLNKLAEFADVEKSLLDYHVRGSRGAKGLEPWDRASTGSSREEVSPSGVPPQMPPSV